MLFNEFITDVYTAAVEGVSEEDWQFMSDTLKLLIPGEEVENFLFMAQHADENGIETLMSCMEDCLQLPDAKSNLETYLAVTPVVIPDEGEVVDLQTSINLKLAALYQTVYNAPATLEEDPTE